MGKDRLSIDDARNAVESQQLFVSRIQEGHYDALRVGNPAGLQDHVIDRLSSGEELFNRLDEVVPNFTAYTTVCKINGVLLNAFNELSIDVDGPEVID